MAKKLKTIFFGTPDLAVPSLEALISSDFFEVVAIFTQADKAQGRKGLITPPPVKIARQKLQIPVYQPKKIKSEIATIKKLKPDIIVVIAYGQIIPQEILDIPSFGCLNIHGSLLPKYRGAGCIAAPILNGDSETGITFMRMDAGLDTGPILKQEKIKLDKHETAEGLRIKIRDLSAKIIEKTIKEYIKGEVKPKAQVESKASYIPRWKKIDGQIDWTDKAENIEKKIRALNPWPGTFSFLTDKELGLDNLLFKIMAVRPEPLEINEHRSGEIFLYNSALAVQCGQNALVVIKLQIAGKKMMAVDEFLRGYKNIIGCRLHNGPLSSNG